MEGGALILIVAPSLSLVDFGQEWRIDRGSLFPRERVFPS